jgi:hypothetical protein
MDLQSFSPANQVCIFELGRLVDGVSIVRVASLVDDSTDRSFLESTLDELWQNMSVGSPNQTVASPTARLFPIKRQSESELMNLVSLLLRSTPNSIPA